MINKRLLIKNILAFYDENSFYDKKRQLNLHTANGKAKFLKHICALSNSNPKNNAYLVVGIQDNDNVIIGVDFYDDSKIQNLVDAYLNNPPLITYDNVSFDSLSSDSVVGLVTIKPKTGVTSFKRSISTIEKDTFFFRIGSNSIPNRLVKNLENNFDTVTSIERNSWNNLQITLDSVLNFVTKTHRDISPKYKVFKEQFVLCWAGNKSMVRGTPFYSRMDISFINEQIKLFYSDLDSVTIFYNQDEFVITEYLNLGLNDRTSYYPFVEIAIKFNDNGTYEIQHTLLFNPPKYNQKILNHIYNASLKIINKILTNQVLSVKEERVVQKLSFNLMLCYLNGFQSAKEELISIKDYFKVHKDPNLFKGFKEVMRILRKLKYEKELKDE
ncbi:DUF5929 domain-containing protein [Myroides sp. LJL119]